MDKGIYTNTREGKVINVGSGERSRINDHVNGTTTFARDYHAAYGHFPKNEDFQWVPMPDSTKEELVLTEGRLQVQHRTLSQFWKGGFNKKPATRKIFNEYEATIPVRFSLSQQNIDDANAETNSCVLNQGLRKRLPDSIGACVGSSRTQVIYEADAKTGLYPLVKYATPSYIRPHLKKYDETRMWDLLACPEVQLNRLTPSNTHSYDANRSKKNDGVKKPGSPRKGQCAARSLALPRHSRPAGYLPPK